LGCAGGAATFHLTPPIGPAVSTASGWIEEAADSDLTGCISAEEKTGRFGSSFRSKVGEVSRFLQWVDTISEAKEESIHKQ